MVKLTRKLITITEQQNQHLNTLSAQTGMPVTEIIRRMIDNSNEVNFKQIVESNDAKLAEYKKVKASLKYYIYLLNRATNSISQIEKRVSSDSKLDCEALNVLNLIKQQLSDLRGDVDEYCKSNTNK